MAFSAKLSEPRGVHHVGPHCAHALDAGFNKNVPATKTRKSLPFSMFKTSPPVKRPVAHWHPSNRKTALTAMVAMEMFVVATATFRLLYALIAPGHDQRKVRHFNVTEHPAQTWLSRQITEAFP